MGLFNRIPDAFDALRASVPKKERIMAWASGSEQADGEPTLVIATDKALYAPGYMDRLPWQNVFKAEWEDPILEILVAHDGITGWVRLNLDDPGRLPLVIHERVTTTIVIQQHVDLIDNRGATLVARRAEAGDEINWEVIFDAGLDPSDPRLRQLADDQLDQLKASVGI